MSAHDQQGLANSESHAFLLTEDSLAETLVERECPVCSNLLHAERQSIHSFLWEGMMSPHVRRAFLEGRGFCARHFGIARRIEDDSWPAGGIGLSILCQDLVKQAIAQLPPKADLVHRQEMGPFHRKHTFEIFVVGSGCIFCRERLEREKVLVEMLEYSKNKPTWPEKLERSPLCVYHALLALQIWREPDDRLQLRATLESNLEELKGDLQEFIRKHDWQYRDEALGRERNAPIRAMESLTGLQRQFPVPKIGREGGGHDGTRER